MATAKLSLPVPPPTVTLDLSIVEAAVIMKLVGRVSGGHENRKYTSAVDKITLNIHENGLSFTGSEI